MEFSLLIEIVLFCLGAIFASFTGVVVERVNTGQAWWKGRSRCNSCNRELQVVDLIPIISLVLFRGRCRKCKSRISLQYSFVELVLGVLFVLSYIHIGLTYVLPLFLAFLVLLDFVVLYDLRHTIVPMWAAGGLIVLGAAVAVLQATDPYSLLITFAIAIIVALFFYLLFVFSRGRAMGLGDTPVAFALSSLVGKEAAIPGLLFSFWVGAVIGIALLLLKWRGTTMKSEIPFVPFLAIGYLLAFFTGWNPLLLTF